MRPPFRRAPGPRSALPAAAAAAALAFAAGLGLTAPRPAAADHVHSGRLLHPGAARTRILVREVGHGFHHPPHRARRWHGPVWFGHHRLGPGHPHHHPGCGHRVGPRRHGHPPFHGVVAPGFFCNRCRVHFDRPRAFRHHAWHHHGIGPRSLGRISVHVDGLTVLF